MEAFAIINVSEISDEFLTSIVKKIRMGKAVIAVTEGFLLVGFWYPSVKQNGEMDQAYRVYRIAQPGKEKILNWLQ